MRNRMQRREFLRKNVWGAIGASLSGAGSAARGAKRPNFVFFLIDDLGWADLGCYGSEFYESPNLDRFAASGVRFTDAYSAGTVCSPTRASILTGKYPARVGITDYIPGLKTDNTKLLAPDDLHQLPLEEVTIAEALKEASYRTFYAGKWHLGEQGYSPREQGFEVNVDRRSLGFDDRNYYKKPAPGAGVEPEYLTDRLTAESIRFLENVGDQPFLLYVAFHTVHTPIQACRRHVERFRRKLASLPRPAGPALGKERRGNTRLRQDDPEYASMVYALDENVGRLLRKLEERKLADNTVVIFTSDNGGLCTHGNPQGGPTSNRPLRAGKGWCYEGGIRVPAIIRAPGVTRPGTVCGVPVVSMDYYPTMLELAGLPLRPNQHVDGSSLASLLRGGAALPRKAIFWHYPHYHGSTWAPGAAVRAGDWKLIEFYEEQTVELYDLRHDIGERNNLAQAMPEKVKELAAMLHAWQQSVGARMPKPNPAYRPA